MTSIIMNQPCELCNGDGYKTVSKDEWEAYKIWLDDPSEDKFYLPTNFPGYLMTMRTLAGASVLRDQTHVVCPKCLGQKSVPKQMTLDDLKKLLT
jgi:hypothetical protein